MAKPPSYRALNRIEISVSSLVANYHYLVKKSGHAIFPVLKSNAYGHGIVPVAQALDKVMAPFFCVDSLFEAYQLYEQKISTSILIIGYVHPDSLSIKTLPFSYAVYEEKMLEAVGKYQPHAGVHIFVDTGMHREGVSLNKLAEFIRKCNALNLKVEGLMSHLAMGDKPTDINTQKQVESFEKAKQIMKDEGVTPRWFHLGASSFILNHDQYPRDISNASRAGIALYGIDPENKNFEIQPTLKLISTVIQVKDLTKGEKVGYDFTYTVPYNLKIAVLPIGYNDGINRRLSNKGSVLIKDITCPILGRVSMNLCVVDVSKVTDISVGDEAVIFSNNPHHINSIINSVELCETIPYEILVYLHTSTKRVVIL